MLTVIAQRHPADCGIAALSMLLGVAYDEVLIVVGRVQPRALTRGLFLTEMVRIAQELGFTLRTARYSPKRAGIVRVAGKGLGHDSGHVVVQVALAEGFAIADPDGGRVFPSPEEYFAIGVTAGSMLIKV